MEKDCGDNELVENQKGWCKACSVDFENIQDEIKNLNELIIELGEHALGVYGLEKDTWKATKLAIQELHEDREYADSILCLASSDETKTRPIEKSLLDLFSYLLLAEGVYSKYIRIFSIMLVENDHDLFDPNRNEFVTSPDQLDKIDLSIKLKFLKKHGFGLFVDTVDKKLRNDIAHLNLRVLSNGKIVEKRSGAELKDLEQKVQRLRWICTLVGITFDYLFWKCKDPTY